MYVHRREGMVSARVVDDGPGIPKDESEKVFRRLYRLEKSRSTEGTGLGLSMVTAIADLHGASITVARQPSCPVPTTTLAGFDAAGVGVLFGVLSQLSPSFWLPLMVVAGISS